MHADLDALALDLMCLDLPHGMGDVVHLEQMPVLYLTSQDFLKGLTGIVRQHLPVGKGIIGSAAHGSHVTLPFRRVERSTYQLAVGQFDAVLVDRLLKFIHIVGANLMAKAPRAAMDLHRQLPLYEPHHLRRPTDPLYSQRDLHG